MLISSSTFFFFFWPNTISYSKSHWEGKGKSPKKKMNLRFVRWFGVNIDISVNKAHWLDQLFFSWLWLIPNRNDVRENLPALMGSTLHSREAVASWRWERVTETFTCCSIRNQATGGRNRGNLQRLTLPPTPGILPPPLTGFTASWTAPLATMTDD